MHTASIWTRLVGGEVFGSHAGGVLEEDKETKQREQRSQSEWLCKQETTGYDHLPAQNGVYLQQAYQGAAGSVPQGKFHCTVRSE